jgi:tRNA pseudouridine38/39 synthase
MCNLCMLNGILPPSIWVYAWLPILSSLRVSHAEHDTNIFSPCGTLDAMRVGVVQLIGEHNFHNLYKLDLAKQLTSFQWCILCVDISPPGSGDMHVFDLVGTVFLYNQVWHIMAVLLLTGAQFELPSVIFILLNVDLSAPSMHPEDEEPQPLVTCKLEY